MLTTASATLTAPTRCTCRSFGLSFAVAWLVATIWLFVSPAHAAYLKDSLYATTVEIPGAAAVIETGGKGDGDLSTLLLGSKHPNEFIVGSFAFTSDGSDGSSSRASAQALEAAADAGTYTATAVWGGTYVKTSDKDELTYYILVPPDALTISDNGAETENTLQIAELSLEIKVDAAQQLFTHVRLESLGRETMDASTANNLPGGTIDGIPDIQASYTADPFITGTINLSAIKVGDTFSVEQTLTSVVKHGGGENSVSSDISLETMATPTLCEDVVKTVQGSTVLDAVQVNALGPVIIATFDPNFDLTLPEAAEICGVDNFNWLQHVTHRPADWDVRADGKLITDPTFLDPIPGVMDLRILDKGTGTEAIVLVDPLMQDNRDPYYTTLYATNPPAEDPNDEILNFYDRPSFRVKVLEDNEFLSFRTELVGEKNGKVIPLGVGFTWNSDTVNVSDLSYISVIDDGTLPAILSGGVFDVRVFVVPEPSSPAWLMMAWVSSGLLVWRRERWPAAP